MKLNCSQCKETLTVSIRIKVVSDTDIYSFCSQKCRDKWICTNATDRESHEVAKGVFILCPSPLSWRTYSDVKEKARGPKNSEVRVMDKERLFCSGCKEQIANDHPVLENPTRKNPFCRRSGIDRRSGKERRLKLDATKYEVDRRESAIERRRGQDRRKHDYWNSNYSYWNTTT